MSSLDDKWDPVPKPSGMFNLLVCVSGIYVCFIPCTVLEEIITKTTYTNSSGASLQFTFIFLRACQSLASALWALLCLAFTRQGVGPCSRDVLKTYLLVASTASVALFVPLFGYESLHINHPTHMLVFSCELVPVMLMGVLLHRRKYAWSKYVSVLLITAGVSTFMLLTPAKGAQVSGAQVSGAQVSGAQVSGAQVSGAQVSNSVYGLLPVTVNVLLDAYTTSTQDELLKGGRVSGFQLMFWQHLLSCGLMLLWVANPLNPELLQAVEFLARTPEALRDIGLLCLCSALGRAFLFKCLSSFGSITLLMTTTVTPILTLLMTTVMHIIMPTVFDQAAFDQMGWAQWLAIAVAFVGISINLFAPKEKQH